MTQLKQFLSFQNLLLLFVVVQLCIAQEPQTSKITPYNPAVYQFNLNLPYYQRMYQFFNDYRTQIKAYYDIGILGVQQQFPQSYLDSIGLTKQAFYNFSNKMLLEEIYGTAEILDVDPYSIFYSQIVMGLIEPYTNPKACTCALIQNEQKQMFFGKDFDFNLGGFIGNVTVTGEFYKDGKLLYTAQVWPISLGFITGMRQNAFAITLNARFGGSVADNVNAFLTTGFPSNYLVKYVLENAETYDQAVQMLQNYPIDYNVYYCIIGTQWNQGAVIARNINSYENITTFNNTDRWFIVQTNYDRNISDPSSDYRRVPAENKIEAIGYNSINIQNLYNDVMSEFPNNNAGTILTIMMSPQTNYWFFD